MCPRTNKRTHQLLLQRRPFKLNLIAQRQQQYSKKKVHKQTKLPPNIFINSILLANSSFFLLPIGLVNNAINPKNISRERIPFAR